MSCIWVFRDFDARDRDYVRRALFGMTPPDWAISDRAVHPDGWHVLHGRTCNVDFVPGGGAVPPYAAGQWNGIAHHSLLDYGRISNAFNVVAEDGRTWRVEAITHL